MSAWVELTFCGQRRRRERNEWVARFLAEQERQLPHNMAKLSTDVVVKMREIIASRPWWRNQ